MIMNVLLLLAMEVTTQAAGSGRVERIVTTFGVNWPQLLAQVASFCIVCIILYQFAYRPVLKMLEVRREQIAQGQANAEQIKAELAKTEAQIQAIERDRGLPRLPKFFINMYLPPARQSETAVELARHIAQEFEANAYGSSRNGRTSRMGSAAGRFRSRQGVAPGGDPIPMRLKSM